MTLNMCCMRVAHTQAQSFGRPTAMPRLLGQAVPFGFTHQSAESVGQAHAQATNVELLVDPVRGLLQALLQLVRRLAFTATCAAASPHSSAKEFSSPSARRRCCRLVFALLNLAFACALAFALALAAALALAFALAFAFAFAAAGGMAPDVRGGRTQKLSQHAAHQRSDTHL